MKLFMSVATGVQIWLCKILLEEYMNQFSKYCYVAFAVCVVSAGDAFACSGSSISVAIVDEGRGGRTLRVSEISDPALQKFVVSVASRVEDLIEEKEGCTVSDESALLFVKSSLIYRGSSMPRSRSSDSSQIAGCRLYSPWVDFEVDHSASPKVRGIIRWSQRQLLIDQAMMDGVTQAADVEAVALSSDEFERYAKIYADSEILNKPKTFPLESSVPADILWLFRGSWQSTRGPFSDSARGSMRKLMDLAATGYADLVVGLIDNCISNGQASQRYLNILDLEGVMPLDSYRVEEFL